MSSDIFVINEWILHELAGEHGRGAQDEGSRFLKSLKERGDQIAVLKDSPWMKKALNLWQVNDPIVRRICRYLHFSILYDSRVCRLLDRDDIKELPENVKEQIPTDDLYLVQIYLSASASLFVTNDSKLFNAISNATSIKAQMRDEFITNYLGR